jgi:hypothetical protein
MRFGKLVIQGLAEPDAHSHCRVECVCDCDPSTVITVRFDNMLNGRTVACGCVKVENFNGYRDLLRKQIPLALAARIWTARNDGVSLEDKDYDEVHSTSNRALAAQFKAELDAAGVSKSFRNRDLAIQQSIRRVNDVIEEHLGSRIWPAIWLLEREIAQVNGPHVSTQSVTVARAAISMTFLNGDSLGRRLRTLAFQLTRRADQERMDQRRKRMFSADPDGIVLEGEDAAEFAMDFPELFSRIMGASSVAITAAPVVCDPKPTHRSGMRHAR